MIRGSVCIRVGVSNVLIRALSRCSVLFVMCNCVAVLRVRVRSESGALREPLSNLLLNPLRAEN